LILDVNASDLQADISLAHEIATQLRLYDVSIAIDDFHPGEALAKKLEKVPFCELKLDRKYVFNCATDSAKQKLCRSTVDLAHRFGKLAVAEGVENNNDMQVLLQLGCDSAQGYLFSPPLQKEKLIRILASRLKRGI
jgi:EAL domain-containing protein (putative c-di-GMP-specific phosphodiesterase class I)